MRKLRELEVVLRLQDVAKPVVKDGEVLVRVHAASVHIGDWMLVTGVPYIARPAYGLRKPKSPVPGTDIAGTVEAVGDGVTQLRPGDEVFGWCAGAFAEYACAAEDHFVLKPANLTFEQAVAVGVSASTALQLLRDQGNVQPDQRVLINGASGGLGTFAVQIAKAFGTEVTGVCSTRNVDMVRSIGADHVIDSPRTISATTSSSTTWRTTRCQIPAACSPPPVSCSPTMNVGRSLARNLGHRHQTAIASMFERRQLGPAIKFQNRADLIVLKGLIEAAKVTPVIDGTYPLSQAAVAIGHVGEGHARGTVVIIV